MKRLLACFLALMLLLPAVALGEEVKTLELMWFSDGAETAAMQRLIDEYEALNPNIKIELLEVPFEDMSKKIMMAASGGEAPALVRTTEGITSNCKEAYVDIADYVEDTDALLAQFMGSIQSYFVQDGKICALPTDVTANGLLYNKTAFDKAGVAVPTSSEDIWTWDEFIAALRTVMEKGDVTYGMVIDNPTHRWSTILYEYGGRLVSPEGPAFNSPESLAAIAMTKSLFDEGIVPKSTWLGGEDPNNLFRSGQVAVHLAGNWMLTNYRDNIKDFEWGVTYMPIEKNRSSVPGGKQLAACANTGVEKEAVDFILWVTGQEANKQYCEESLFISPRLDNAQLNYAFGSEFFAIFADELANTVDDAAFDWGFPGLAAKIGTELTYGMYDVIAGTRTAEDLVETIDALSAELFE